MKIAITADLHLTTYQEHPERYDSLTSLLEQIQNCGVQTVIVAGDLFDQNQRNYSDFENLLMQDKFKDLMIHILPGNHDLRLNPRSLTRPQIRVHETAGVQLFHEKLLPVLFIPYEKDKTMGERIAEFKSDLMPNQWILIGHGDWVEGLRELNPMEPGVYMPLTRLDIESYTPKHAFLGHIHKPIDSGRLHYPGSPLGLNINETGQRRFLILDLETGDSVSQPLNTEFIYLNETLTVVPGAGEMDYIRLQADRMRKEWGFDPGELRKCRLRLKVVGYAHNRQAIRAHLDSLFNDVNFNDEPDLDELYVADDPERQEIANRVTALIEKLDWESEDDIDNTQILIHALRTIYGD